MQKGRNYYSLADGFQQPTEPWDQHSPHARENTPIRPAEPERFPEKPKYQDIFFSILFGMHLIAVALIFYLGYVHEPTGIPAEGAGHINKNNILPFDQLWRILYVCGSSAGVAIVFAMAWLSIMKKYAQKLIVFTIIMNTLMLLFSAAYMFYIGVTVAGIILLLLCVLTAAMYYWWKNIIPFSTAMLVAVSQILKNYPAPTYYALVSLVIQALWVLAWIFTFTLVQKFSGTYNIAAVVFLLISFYWVMQVLKNVVHVTASGLYATWYFLSEGGVLPPDPTISSFKRATTTSFGSICLGSLIVAVLNAIRTLIRAARREGDSIVACLADCLISCIDSLVQYFNLYAFTQVAIYGKSFIRAARDTWELVKYRGVDAIINDNLISGVLLMGSVIGGVLCGVLGIAFSSLFGLEHYWISMAIVSFLIGLSLVSSVMEVVESGVATIFVCFAMDPESLLHTCPSLYHTFAATYPGVSAYV